MLAELLQSRPNFLVLDEPTNHMDVQAKETLESAFQAYQGTILFVSHDRYFIRQVAQSVLIFEETGPMYYPFGYEHYLEKRQKAEEYGEELSAQVKAEDAALLEGMRTVPEGGAPPASGILHGRSLCGLEAAAGLRKAGARGAGIWTAGGRVSWAAG